MEDNHKIDVVRVSELISFKVNYFSQLFFLECCGFAASRSSCFIVHRHNWIEFLLDQI